jgi:hypothetical protein
MLKWKNLLFVAVCVGVFLFLYNAPPETTKRTPADETHANPKVFEGCPKCHMPGGEGPQVRPDHIAGGALRSDHIKCYMCHKPAKK